MNHHLFLMAVAMAIVTISGCGRTSNPLEQAIVENIKETNPDVADFEVSELLLENTVTLEKELTRRQCIFINKEKSYRQKAESYVSKNMRVNASKNDSIARSAAEILQRIEAYRETHTAQMDSVIYYVFRMKGIGHNNVGLKIDVKDYYVTVSPTEEVFAVLPPRSNPYKGMGKVIPGYFTEILGRDSDEN